MSDAPGFEVAGKKFYHTEKPWCVKTNRHTSTRGFSWGWIEGPLMMHGNYTWSDDPGSSFTSADASEAVRMQAEWLDLQEPLSIKIVKAYQVFEMASMKYRTAQESFDRAKDELGEATERLKDLRVQQTRRALENVGD